MSRSVFFRIAAGVLGVVFLAFLVAGMIPAPGPHQVVGRVLVVILFLSYALFGDRPPSFVAAFLRTAFHAKPPDKLHSPATGLPEDGIPVDKEGRPDLAFYSHSIEHYIALYERYIAAVTGRADSSDVPLAFRLRVHGTWGLIAKGEEAVSYALNLLKRNVPEAREDGAAILGEIGKRDGIIDTLVRRLSQETDRQALDSTLMALGEMRNWKAAPALAAIIRDKDVDSDSRWTAVESLGKIARKRFLKQVDPVAAARDWLDEHDY